MNKKLLKKFNYKFGVKNFGIKKDDELIQWIDENFIPNDKK